MKFSIGTASSNMEFEESLKLIKSSLLYADEIELIGMAEYAVFNYLPKCLKDANDFEGIIENLIPFFEAFDNQKTLALAEQLNEIRMAMEPFMPLLKKKKKRNKQEIIAQIKLQQTTKQCNVMLNEAMETLLNHNGTKTMQSLIDKNVVSVYDYSYTGFSVDELTGGYIANLLGTMKHNGSFPLFDSISSDVVKTVIDSKILDFSKTDKEIIRHAGIANNIFATLPTLDKAPVDEILDFKKDLSAPLINFRKAIYLFSEQIASMPWDDNFQYECLKLYDTEVMPKINEINELSSETSVLKNFGRKVLSDEEERKKLGYVGAGLATTITTGSNIVDALGVLENLLHSGAKIGLTATGIAAFLKTADLLRQAHAETKEKKTEIEGNVMYYYYKASKKF